MDEITNLNTTNDELKSLLIQHVSASKAIADSAQKKAEEYANQARECQETARQIELDRISRDELTIALQEQNRITDARLQVAESILDTIKKIFLDDKTIEELLLQHTITLDNINSVLIKIATVLQLQATKVIEVLVLDENTRKDYNKLLSALSDRY